MSTTATVLDPLRVVLVDDTPDIRFLLRLALDLDGGCTVVGEAGDGRQALAVVAETQPDLVLLDLAMPDVDGMQALPLLRECCPAATILVLSGFEDAALAPAVLAAGADGYLRKGAAPRDILARAHAAGPARRREPTPVDPGAARALVAGLGPAGARSVRPAAARRRVDRAAGPARRQRSRPRGAAP